MTSASSGRTRIARTFGRRGLLVALVTAGALYVLLLVQGTLLTLIQSIGQIAAFGPRVDRDSNLYSLTDLGPSLASIWGSQVQYSLLTDLPLAVGVFVSFWQLLPIAPELRFAHVVTRSLFSAGFGAAAVLVVGVIQTLVLVASQVSAEDFGRSSSAAGSAIGSGILGSVLHAAGTWVTDVPLVVLAGLLLWGFLQRFVPDHSVSGVVDEL